MEKSEPDIQRFRRKAKGQRSSSTTNEQRANPTVSSASAVDNLLCNNLLEADTEPINSSAKQTFQHPHSLSVANGACDAEAILTDGDPKERDQLLSSEDSVEADHCPPREDQKRSKDFCLTSYLPAELSGFSHSEIIPLCSSQSLDLSACHVQTDNSVVLVVFITKTSEDANLQIQVLSEELEVGFMAGNNYVSTTFYNLNVLSFIS